MKYILFFVLTIILQKAVIAQDEIKASVFFDHLSYLASDKQEGRFPGTKGNKRAASYIAKSFKSYKLNKTGLNYYQPFKVVVKLTLTPESFLQSEGSQEWRFNKNFSVYSFSGSAQVQAPIVLIGDSTGLLNNQSLVKKKWAVVNRQKPGNTASNVLTDYSVATMAAEHQAAGVIFINQDTADKEDLLVRLRPGSQKLLTIPVIQAKRNDWQTLRETYFGTNITPGAISSKSLNASLRIVPQEVITNNIIGIIEGSDPVLKKEYIILGAHYDHLGWGGYGTGSRKPDTVAIHNGADDNASGTSALLTIAQELSRNRSSLKRSLILIAFGAEEEGLLGSSYFVQHLPVLKEAIKVMVNMDMVGRLNTEKQLYMGGAGTFPGGVELMKEMGEGSGLNLVVHAGGVGGSDHVSFYKAGISAVGMHTGGHPQYHMPEDDAPLINQEGAQLVCRYIYKVISALANRNVEFRFVPQD